MSVGGLDVLRCSAAAALVAACTLLAAAGEDVRVLRVPAAGESVPAEVLLSRPWGAGLGEFGRVEEASRPGPMDFAIGGDALYVLDPVNARVQLFGLDGRFRRTVPIGTRTADFLCVDEAGHVTVLDAFVRREFMTFAESGELLTQAKLPEAVTLCSGSFTADGRLWVEERHTRAYELEVDRSRTGAAARIVGTLAGRPRDQGQAAFQVARVGTDTVRVQTGETRESGEVVIVHFPRPVAAVQALEADASGRLYVAVTCPLDATKNAWKSDLVLAAIEPAGGVVGTLRMPNAYVTDHYRKLCVTSAGDVIQMQTSEEGVRFVRWTPEPLRAGRVTP